MYFVDLTEEVRDEFQRAAEVDVDGDQQFSGVARIDTGCPVSLIKNGVVDCESVRKAGREWERYSGINQSKLRVLGIVDVKIRMEGDSCKVVLGVVLDDTINVPLLLGRNVLKSLGYSLTKNSQYDRVVTEIFNINALQCSWVDNIRINDHMSQSDLSKLRKIVQEVYVAPTRPIAPKTYVVANIVLKNEQPVQFGSRRLGYTDKEKVREIITSLTEREIIRPSISEFASPIVLTRKKNGEISMCVDYRALNKAMMPDNYPLPLIEDQLDMLRDKCFFSKLDLKDGFCLSLWHRMLSNIPCL